MGSWTSSIALFAWWNTFGDYTNLPFVFSCTYHSKHVTFVRTSGWHCFFPL